MKFSLCGRILTHAERPRFSMIFRPADDGGWDGECIVPIKDEVPNAATMARLTREAGDFFAANHRRDWLQETVIARAAALGLTAYGIAARTGEAVSEGHIRAYLLRKKSMGSHKLQHVLRALGLRLTQEAGEASGNRDQ